MHSKQGPRRWEKAEFGLPPLVAVPEGGVGFRRIRPLPLPLLFLLAATLKHLPVLSGDWLEPQPDPEVEGGQPWLDPKSGGYRAQFCWVLCSLGLSSQAPAPHPGRGGGGDRAPSSSSSSGLKGRLPQTHLLLRQFTPSPHSTNIPGSPS